MAGASGRRRLPKRIVAAGMAVSALALAASAQGAAETLPSGGSTFDVDAQGWTATGETCSLGGGVSLLCDANAAYDATGGNPGGALDTQVTITLNALGVISGSAVWTSPAFTAPAGSGAVLRYDRAFEPGGLVNLGPTSTIAASLVDVAAGTSTALGSDSLTGATASYATREQAVDAGALVPGRSYRLRFTVTTASGVAALNVAGDAHTRIDNVGLAVGDAAGAGGGNGAGGTGGDGRDGTVVRPPLSAGAIDGLIDRLNVGAETGRGSGGSVIPLSACTIVGTPGKDRITGTRGNDVICGLGGNDTISGGGGRDAIDGANGNDRLNGGAGADALIGVRGNDRETAGTGNDRAGGGAGKDVVSGGAGKDRITGGSAADRITGGAAADRLGGDSGGDRIVGGKGRDVLRGGGGNDLLGGRDRTRDLVDGGRGRDRAKVDGPATGARGRSRTDRVLRVERRL